MAKKSEIKKRVIKRWKIARVKKGKDVAKQKATSTFTSLQVVTIMILTSLLSLFMGIAIALPQTTETENKYSDEINDFVKEYLKIKKDYYADMDDKEKLQIALEAIINSLDAHSTVVDDSLSNSLNTKLQGTYQGFGIEIVNDVNNNIIIVGVVEDSPAEAADLQVLDVIKRLDNQEITGMTTTDFVSMVQASANTDFELVVERDGKEVTVELQRKKVTLKSVATETYERNNKKVGYIYVSLFAYNTDVQFSEALEELEKSGIDSLIVDLRYNTGGHLSSVENMMSKFLDKTHVIYQIQTKESTEKTYSRTDEKRDYDVVVLVNDYSASASEMFAATMQEEYGATIIGTTTYGKGTVQKVKDSTSSDMQYKLTTEKWLTPKGNWINDVGITPDVVVELEVDDESEFTDEQDNQLQAAINYLAK